MDANEATPLFTRARTVARHRRTAYVACTVVVAGLVVGAFIARGHGPAAQRSARPNPALIKSAAASFPVRNGPLTLIVQDSTRSGIYTVRSDGGLRTLVDCPQDKCLLLESFAWAPSGRLIAFDVSCGPTATGYEGIHIMDLSTRTDRNITSGCAFIDDLAWSPDGSRLAYVTDNDAGTGKAIRVIAADGSSSALPVNTGVGRPSSPTWSRNPQRLAFAVRRKRRSFVYVSDLDGLQPRLIAVDASAPAWSPDGSRIAVHAYRGIKFLTPSGRDVTPECAGRPCGTIGVAGKPVWSPDGHKIAIQTRRSGTFVMQANGRNLHGASDWNDWGAAGGAHPSWRPMR